MDELLRSPDYPAKPESTAGFGAYLYVLRQLWSGELRPTGRLRYAVCAASRRTLYTGIALLCARRQRRPQRLKGWEPFSKLAQVCILIRGTGSGTPARGNHDLYPH